LQDQLYIVASWLTQLLLLTMSTKPHFAVIASCSQSAMATIIAADKAAGKPLLQLTMCANLLCFLVCGAASLLWPPSSLLARQQASRCWWLAACPRETGRQQNSRASACWVRLQGCK
jgi:hypothetical protein